MRLPSLFFALYLIASSCAFAGSKFLENGQPHRGADCGFLLDSPTRMKIDLSGSWGFLADAEGGTVPVPSAYEIVGQVTFDRKFTMTARQLDEYRFHLVMFGANYNTSVWVNGDFLMNHIGGYTSFVQSIPSNQLQVGDENFIKVVTNNELDARRSIPIRSQVWGWRNYGGMLRDVFLLGTPKLYISDVAVHADVKDSTSARLSVAASIDGMFPEATTSDLSICSELVDSSGNPIARSRSIPLRYVDRRWLDVTTELVVTTPRLWSPESPSLYTLRCLLVRGNESDSSRIVDQLVFRYGIRKITLQNGQIVVNGRRTVLKGVVWQEQNSQRGSSLTYEDMENDVALMKDLGANAIRFGSHPPHPFMVSLCDRYGLFALIEMPVVNAPAAVLNEEYYVELATPMLREMIVRDRNHASVIAWGIGDEFESSSPLARSYVEAMVTAAKRLDDRPVYYGTRLLGSDTCAGLVDMVLLNPETTEIRHFKKQLEEWNAQHPAQPMLVGKCGVEVQDDNRNGYSDPLSYEAQARFLLQYFDAAKSVDCDGTFAWSFNDWKGDRPALTVSSGDPYMHTLGLVNVDRKKRLAFEAIRSLFHSEKPTALPIGSYTASAPIVYVLIGLVTLIGTAYLYNASRRFRESLNRSLMNSYNFFADLRDQHAVPIPLTLLLGVLVSLGAATALSSLLFFLRNNLFLDNLFSYLLVTDAAKEMFVYLVRRPVVFILACTLMLFVTLLLIAGVVKIASRLFKARVSHYHAFSVSIWSTSPLLILVPIGMILYRALESSTYVVPSVVLFGLLLLWVVFRLLKGMSIIFDVFTPKMYLLGVMALVAIATLGYAYLDYTQSASMHVRFMYRMLGGG